MSYFHPTNHQVLPQPQPYVIQNMQIIMQNIKKDFQLPVLCLISDIINANIAYYSSMAANQAMMLNSGLNSNSTTTTSSNTNTSLTQSEAKPKLNGEDRSVVRLMCSMGGRILPRPHDNQLRYVGGTTHLVAFQRNITYSSFMLKLSKMFNVGSHEFTVKYQLPYQGFDSLISLVNHEDVDNMMEEFEALNLQRIKNKNENNNEIIPRMRLFLLPAARQQEIDISRTNTNASEETEYLFGLENSNSGLFGASVYATQPPLKTKLESPNPVEKMSDSKSHQTGGQLWGQCLDPGYPYPADQAYVQSDLVYYVPAGPGLGVNPHLQQSGQQAEFQVPLKSWYTGSSHPYQMHMPGNMVSGQPPYQG